jgi:hypothetical protein
MSRRETLGNLSPGSRPSMAGRTAAGGGKEGAGRQSMALGMKPGRPSVAPGAGLDRRSSAFGKGSAGLKARGGWRGGAGAARASAPAAAGRAAPRRAPRRRPPPSRGARPERRPRPPPRAPRRAAAPPQTDPRPLGDKNFLNGCIRTVITYLSTHGYPYAVSPKVLTSPTGKDFAQIVQFLFQRFDPTMKVFGKVEDEVPLFFRRLNYPFQISKSALFAVGSPHSWPSVLAALTWLVELLNYEEKAEEAASDPAGPAALDSDRQRSERAFYDYVSNTYRRGAAGGAWGAGVGAAARGCGRGAGWGGAGAQAGLGLADGA